MTQGNGWEASSGQGESVGVFVGKEKRLGSLSYLHRQLAGVATAPWSLARPRAQEGEQPARLRTEEVREASQILKDENGLRVRPQELAEVGRQEVKMLAGDGFG